MRRLMIVLAAAAIALPALAEPASVTVELKGPEGEDMGVATLTEGPRGVLLRLEARGLKPGWHGLHFHQKGDCSAVDFTSAGPHVHDQAAAIHGLLKPGANEAGDLPNVWATTVGVSNAEVFTPWVSLTGADGRPALLDADGSALVIHAGPDDHLSQPIGGAGARVACGVIAAP